MNVRCCEREREGEKSAVMQENEWDDYVECPCVINNGSSQLYSSLQTAFTALSASYPAETPASCCFHSVATLLSACIQ